MQPPFFAGVDDGFNTTIVYTERGETCIRPSRVAIGATGGIDFTENAENAPAMYRTDGKTFTVNPRVSDDTVNDDYPFSGANRVMVQHALSEVNYRDTEQGVVICTGLPIRRFYKASGEKNESVINRKMASLEKAVNPLNDSQEGQGIRLQENIVKPESLTAIFDLMFEERRKTEQRHTREPELKIHKGVFNEHVAFIDIGGRTTDIAIWSGGHVEKGDFGTKNVGMENIRSELKEHLMDEFDLDSVPDAHLTEAMKTGKIKLANRTFDVQNHLDQATSNVTEQIRNHIANILGSKANLINKVAFLGGGSEQLYHKGLSDIYEHQQLMDNPIVVNARSFYKFLRYMHKLQK